MMQGAWGFMPGQYILWADRKPLPCENIAAWVEFFKDSDARRVAYDAVGEVSVSTVFLGLDHNFGNGGPPVLFETMIFGGPHDEDQWRYCTWEEAEEGHKAACELAFHGSSPEAREQLERMREARAIDALAESIMGDED